MTSSQWQEVYNQFVCSWVKEFVVCKVDTKFVTTGKVRIILLEFQNHCAFVKCFALSDTPLKCWLILQECDMCCTHCNCMAGLGEACTQVVIVLVCFGSTYQNWGTKSLHTEGQFAWVVSSSMKSAQYLPIKELELNIKTQVWWRHWWMWWYSPWNGEA